MNAKRLWMLFILMLTFSLILVACGGDEESTAVPAEEPAEEPAQEPVALSVLGGRAADSPNLVLAGAAIAVLPPVIIYIFGQRFFVESATSSAVKG